MTHNWFAARSNDFGQKLRAWRKARRLRQMDACAAFGLPPDQVETMVANMHQDLGSETARFT